MRRSGETALRFDCFGGRAAIFAAGQGAEMAVALAQARLRQAHRELSRFLPESELSLLNADPRRVVPCGRLLRSLAAAVRQAGELTNGLVDATQVDAIERAGYTRSLRDRAPLPLSDALAAAPQRRPAGPAPAANWKVVRADDDAGVVIRPPGVRLDSGGLGKGLAADLAAALLARQQTFAVDCAGDLRIGGSAAAPRPVQVADPFGGPPLHQFEIVTGAVATSGIGRRSWLGRDGLPAHHLIDPAGGRPAYTGVVQATALAPTAVEAEIRAKAAVLSGPHAGAAWLVHGGLLVHDDGSAQAVPAAGAAVAA